MVTGTVVDANRTSIRLKIGAGERSFDLSPECKYATGSWPKFLQRPANRELVRPGKTVTLRGVSPDGASKVHTVVIH